MLGMKIKGMERRKTCICMPDVLKGTSCQYPLCNILSLVFIFVLSCWTKMVYITAMLAVSRTILSSDFGVYFFFRAMLIYCVCYFPSQTSSLQYLDARNTPLLDHSAPFVARALRISGSLAVLHLENAGLSGRPLMLLGKMSILQERGVYEAVS